MERIAVLERPFILSVFLHREGDYNLNNCKRNRTSIVFNNLASNGYTDFCQYLEIMGLASERDIMAFSSLHKYYYDTNGFFGVKALIHLTRLNKIAHLDSFLRVVTSLLTEKAFFVGCYEDNENTSSGSYLQASSKFVEALNSRAGKPVVKKLSEKYIRTVLEQNRLRIHDISYINGMSYFCSEYTGIPG